MRYSQARLVLAVLMLVGWAVAIVGTIASFRFYSINGDFSVLLIGALVSIAGGLFWVAVAQIGQALLDTAENTSAIFNHLRVQNSWAVQANPIHQQATLTAALSRSKPDVLKSYRGYKIIRRGDGVGVGGRVFSGVIAAEKWIDTQQPSASPRPPAATPEEKAAAAAWPKPGK